MCPCHVYLSETTLTDHVERLEGLRDELYLGGIRGVFSRLPVVEATCPLFA